MLSGTRCHFLVMAFEVAVRWSPSAVTFLRNLAWYKSLKKRKSEKKRGEREKKKKKSG